MKNISINFIPAHKQRYDTCGDYFEKWKQVRFNISELPKEEYEFLIMIHELIEYGLCTFRGIPLSQIDQFDLQFKGEGEPGDSPSAPYYYEHKTASQVERLLADELRVDWLDYERAIDNSSKLWKMKHKPKKEQIPKPKRAVPKLLRAKMGNLPKQGVNLVNNLQH